MCILTERETTSQELFFNDRGVLVTDRHSADATERVEVMFHVSTLLPFDPVNDQQLHRKRHLGNDVVIVVFREYGARFTLFDPTEMRSQFNHVFVVVTPSKLANNDTEVTHYRVQLCCKRGVKPCRPLLHSAVFRKNELCRYLLLVKLINAER